MECNYEAELPQGYRESFVVDAKSRKFLFRLNLLCLLLTAAGLLTAFLVCRPTMEYLISWQYPAAVAVLLVYIVLHELAHGAAYKLLTGRKLTFGFSLTVAYCGVPDIFVYRKTALISLLSPFVLFSVLFLGGAFFAGNPVTRFYCAVLFSFHLGGCAGDLYDTFLYLTRFRDPAILMQDTGPKQTFYSRQEADG